MQSAISESLSLIGFRGGVILLLIGVLLTCAVLVAIAVRARYASMLGDLRRNQGQNPSFRSRLLNKIVQETEDALKVYPGDVNTQAIIEANFQAELKGLLLGERFTKASVGLLIILGLVGTFLGLTLSIGKLVTLVSQDVEGSAAVTQNLTTGLTDALSGMSIAFSTSLFGILAAIIMTFVNVFISTTDARNGVIAELESFLDNTILATVKGKTGTGLGMDQLVTSFGHSVAHLHEAVAKFETALQTFNTNTRDFAEFNHHLRDNVQRMSLAFSDLTANLRGPQPPSQRHR